MSNTIVVLPTGSGGVAAIGERHRRHEGSRQYRDDERPAEDRDQATENHEITTEHRGSDDGAHRPQPKRADAPAPALDDPGVPAETLFAVTMLGIQLAHQPPSPSEMRLRTGGVWAPPESQLHLKDKLI